MGKIEKDIKKKVRQTKVTRAIVGTIAVAGVLSLAVVAPNAVKLLGGIYSRQRLHKTKTSLSRLITHGYVTLEEENGRKHVRLTPKGERFALRMGEGSLVPKKPHHWDGKWRMLIFDIPERRRKARTQIRQTLTALGFKRLQDSVWVYPYDCEDLMALLKADLKIGKDILYVVADAIEYDVPLRAYFKLPA